MMRHLLRFVAFFVRFPLLPNLHLLWCCINLPLAAIGQMLRCAQHDSYIFGLLIHLARCISILITINTITNIQIIIVL